MNSIIQNEEVKMSKAMKVMFNHDLDISLKARFLYVALMQFEEGREVKHKELMEVTDIKAPKTLIKVIDELKKHNLIRVTRRSYGCLYDVL